MNTIVGTWKLLSLESHDHDRHPPMGVVHQQAMRIVSEGMRDVT